MRDRTSSLKSLIGVRAELSGVVMTTVRETNYGFVVRSSRAAPDGSLRSRAKKIAPYATLAVMACVWLLPGVVAARAGLTVTVLAAGYLAVSWARRGPSATELHVDTSKREVRSVVINAQGVPWVRARARFGEVSSAILQRGRPGDKMRSLGLRITGTEEVMKVVVGEEATLLAVHDRLMRDLRPIEERLAGYWLNRKLTDRACNRVFPQLGPDEVAA